MTGGGTPNRRVSSYYGGSIPWVTPKDMKVFDMADSQERITATAIEESSAKLVPIGSVLIVVRSGILKHSLPVAVARVPLAVNQDLKVLRCGDDLHPDYLARFLKASAPRILGWVRATTAENIPVERLRSLVVPLPPFAEQRRIAAVLDKADAVRHKRRESLRMLDEFLRSAFWELFGNPVRNEKGWDVVGVPEVLQAPLRNGVSPSKGGAFRAPVLTLTAVTGDRFDPSAVKEGMFARRIPREKLVDARDFLICRGNGNRVLTARGKFPTDLPPGVVFPDTMIAARVDRRRIEPDFFEAVWATPAVQDQLQAKARTTSGIYKINQGMLEAVIIPSPPRAIQERFARIVRCVRVIRAQMGARDWSKLSDSLSAHAFRGDL